MLLLSMGVLVGLVILFAAGRSSKTASDEPLKAPSTGFFAPVVILLSRVFRGVLGVVFVLVLAFAYKALNLISLINIGDSALLAGVWALVFVGGSSVLYFVFMACRCLRTKANEMHLERGKSNVLLIKTHWSL